MEIIAMPLMTLKTEKKMEMTVAKLLQELKKHQEVLGYTVREISNRPSLAHERKGGVPCG